MINVLVFGSEGTIITTERGVKALTEKSVKSKVVDLEGSLFYNALGRVVNPA